MCKVQFCFLFTFLFYNFLYLGISGGTGVFLDKYSVKTVEKIDTGDLVISYNEEDLDLESSKVIATSEIYEDYICTIDTEAGEFSVSSSQLLMSFDTLEYVQAKDLSLQNCLVNKDLEPVKIKLIDIRKTVLKTKFYCLSLDSPHSFFVSTSNGHSILAHNNAAVCEYIINSAEELGALVTLGVAALGFLSKGLKKIFKKSNKHFDKAAIDENENEFKQEEKRKDAIPPKTCEFGRENYKQQMGPPGPNDNDPDKLFEKFKKYLRNKNVLPHIFRYKGGHIAEMTEENIKRFLDIIKPENLERSRLLNGRVVQEYNKYWNNVGTIWARTTDGLMDDAGINFLSGIY